MDKYTSRLLNILEQPELNCSDVEEFMSDYIDFELPDTLGKRFHKHINSCMSCKASFLELMLIVNLAKTLKQDAMPDDARIRIHKNLNQKLGLSLPT